MATEQGSSSNTKNLLKKLWADLKKRWPVLVICIGIMIGCYAVLSRHYLAQGAAFQAGLPIDDMVYRIESTLLDWRFKLRGPIKTKTKVGILSVDEKALQKLGRWPISRKYYGRALDNLKKLGVKWVGLDATYSEPEKTTLEDARDSLWRNQTQLRITGPQLQELLKASPSDRSFADGVKRFENLVLGYFYFGLKHEAKAGLAGRAPFIGFEQMENSAVMADMPEGKTLDDYGVKKIHGLVTNIPIINQASAHHAFFSNDGDADAINRWVTLVANIKGNLMPSLALKTVAEYLNRDVMVFFNSHGIESIALAHREDPSDTIEVPVDAYGTGRLLLNHLGQGGSFPYFSLADAYFNTFTKEQRAALKDSVLLFGVTATGINDIRPNPFDPAIDGVENHAAAMENIISGRMMRRPETIFATELAIVLGLGLLFMPFMIWGSAAISGLGVLAFMVSYFYVDQYLWFNKGIWAYMAIPYVQILGMFVGTTLYRHMTEEKEKKKVKGAFQFYLSPDVIDQMLDNPDGLKLGGEKKELTVFFSDVRSFTTISESLSPEKLCELMNEYFTPMTSIILRSKGVLDKYIGDAIMAFWGAPVALPNQADVAANACLDMLVALDKLRQDFPRKGFPVIDIGMGLNTGMMSVGNMGSGERFTYTVMGDSVNLGSRLEGLTKEYGIRAMISEYTYARLTPGKFFTRDLDDIRVKGKNEPVKVFELMRPDFIREQHLIKEFIQAFEAGRGHYKKQEWEKAKQTFFQCLQMKPDDKSTALYMERIAEYQKEAPGEHWDGVYTFTHK